MELKGTFTFMRLVDAFIQSNLYGIQGIEHVAQHTAVTRNKMHSSEDPSRYARGQKSEWDLQTGHKPSIMRVWTW